MLNASLYFTSFSPKRMNSYLFLITLKCVLRCFRHGIKQLLCQYDVPVHISHVDIKPQGRLVQLNNLNQRCASQSTKCWYVTCVTVTAKIEHGQSETIFITIATRYGSSGL
jgi:hypothetical protein